MKITNGKRFAIGMLAATCLSVTAICASVEPARAATVFNLTGTFTDSSTISGALTIDVVTGQVVAANLSYLGSTYSNILSQAPFSGETNFGQTPVPVSYFVGIGSSAALFPRISLAIPGTAAVDSLISYLGGSVCSVDHQCGPDQAGILWASAFRLVDPAQFVLFQTGELNAVPLPAALLLFAASLGVMGLLSRRRKRRVVSWVAPAIVLLTGTFFNSASAASTFVGSTIAAAAGFPDGPFGTAGNTIEAGPIQFVVGPGIEIISTPPIGPLFPFVGPSFDFAATTITITSAEAQHASATFNGYSFFDVFATIDPIVGVTIQSDNTGFFSGDPSRVFFDANTIHVNFQGLSMGPETNIVLSVTFADGQIPLPAALPLFAAGLGVMGLLGWRRKRRAVAVRRALTATIVIVGLSPCANVAQATPVVFQLTLNQTFPDIETNQGTFSIDSAFLTPNTQINFVNFLSFSMAIEGFHFTLSHALLPATEGVLTDASGAVVRFNDSAATILTEFCSAGTGSSSCPIFLVFHDGTSPFYSTSGGDSGGDTQGTYSISVVSNGSQIPLPTALPLFATGLGLMGLLGWRRKRRAAA